MDSPNPKRILVIQLKRAGDVIVTTPLLSSLRAALPGVEIDFLVDKPFAPLLENNPDIHRIQVYDRKAPWKTWWALRAASYDWILDFQSSPRSILAGLFSGARLRAGYRVSFWGRFFSRSIQRPGASVSVTEGKMMLGRELVPGDWRRRRSARLSRQGGAPVGGSGDAGYAARKNGRPYSDAPPRVTALVFRLVRPTGTAPHLRRALGLVVLGSGGKRLCRCAASASAGQPHDSGDVAAPDGGASGTMPARGHQRQRADASGGGGGRSHGDDLWSDRSRFLESWWAVPSVPSRRRV